MREEVKDRGRLEHMLTAIGNVEEFTKDVSKENFVNSKLLFFAVVKNIEIVGEATYMLTKEYKRSHPSIPWLVIEKCVMSWFMDITQSRQRRCGILCMRTFLY